MEIRNLRRALEKKLRAERVDGARHDRLVIFDPEAAVARKLCTVCFSRGARSIDDEGLLRHIATEELHLPSLRHLKELVECSLGGPEALALIRRQAEGLRGGP